MSRMYQCMYIHPLRNQTLVILVKRYGGGSSCTTPPSRCWIIMSGSPDEFPEGGLTFAEALRLGIGNCGNLRPPRGRGMAVVARLTSVTGRASGSFALCVRGED